MAEASQHVATLRLDRTPGLGPRGFARLIARFGDACSALDALPGYARQKRLPQPDIPSETQALDELAAIEKAGCTYLAFGSAAYPAGLSQISDPPPGLIVRGDQTLLHRTNLAIVGARNASAAGMRLAREIASGLAEQDVCIVSGLARGIDGAAHRGALEAATIAVLAGGLDHIYPPEHEALHYEIAEHGLLVSERPLGALPTARCFPRRNRIISGLSVATLVIEAALRSGSLITARYALEQNRDVMALPGSPLDPRAKGTNQLLRDGAHLVENAEDVLALLAQLQPLHIRPDRTHDHAPLPLFIPEAEETDETHSDADDIDGQAESCAQANSLLELLSPTPVAIDEVARQSGRTIASVQGELFELELAGLVECLPSGRVIRLG
ncbi:MAG: DNA-protecting protein DprA [Alphaproteobacteria bacterium]|nr:DNA-protecting protein DprA [Alphaproteobacteria bacterium]